MPTEMDVHHIWFSLKEGVGDSEFAEAARACLGHLRDRSPIAGCRLAQGAGMHQETEAASTRSQTV